MRLRHIVHGIVLCGLVAVNLAQERADLGVFSEQPDRLGLDARSFQHFFDDIAQPPSIEDPRDSIDLFRIWFDESLAEAGLARAEIRARDASRQEDGLIVMTFTDEPVLFNDLGRDADREPGDGIFTAAIPLELSNLITRAVEDPRARLEVVQRLPDFRSREVVDSRSFEAMEEALNEEDRADRLFRLVELGEGVTELRPQELIERLAIDPEVTPIFEALRIDDRFDRRFFDLPFGFFGNLLPSDIDTASSLMITDVGVVEDPARTFDVCTAAGTPGGPWTFAHLMREMAQGSGLSAEDFVLQWLSTWTLTQEANGIIVSDPGRGAQLHARIIDPWIAASGGTPNLDSFPARLLSIVNRPDLANVVGYSQAGSGGEARFVFVLLDMSGGGCNAIPFTVIFEYGIDVSGCFGLKAWHQQWKDLDLHPLGSAAYNAALEAVTRQFTDHGSNPGQLPNQNALAQLRTNENALNPLWELREFTLQGVGTSTPGWLDLVTVKQTPRESLNGSATLAAYAASAAADILAQKHIVPNRFPSVADPFLAATAPTPFGIFWDAPGITGLTDGVNIRHELSFSTCSGCHMRETDTFFTHIGTLGQRPAGSSATLSGFLTGISVTDPVDSSVVRTFSDLARRQQRLADLLNATCFAIPFLPLPLTMVH